MATEKLQKLMEKREALAARIRLEQNKLKATERRSDTRRKILAGATVLEWAARDTDFSVRLMRELDRFLVRDNDRDLFGLPPAGGREVAAPSSPIPGAFRARDLTPSVPELEEA